MIYEYKISTQKESMVNITKDVQNAVERSQTKEGLCVVYCPHTTAGITVNENADPDVIRDFLLGMDKAFPDRMVYRHAEGNSAAHLKASATGASGSFIIRDTKLVLGVWQAIYFCEFDGPRSRTFYVKVIKDA